MDDEVVWSARVYLSDIQEMAQDVAGRELTPMEVRAVQAWMDFNFLPFEAFDDLKEYVKTLILVEDIINE